MNDSHAISRSRMVATQLAARGIRDERVLDAMRAVPRHQFVPPQLQHLAYTDQPLLIGENQTISQPFIVALMTQMLRISGQETVLEIGTGSGYQTAVLCRLAGRVYSLEYYPRLAGRASHALDQLGIENVEIHVGDGSQGLPDMAPFDAIIVTAAAPFVPGPLRSQMSPHGGRLVIPVGNRDDQYLEYVTRMGDRWEIRQTERVRFVPLVGRYGFRQRSESDRPDQPDSGDHFASV
jgi:protein-L-isoaspartate(D-aspartate) O-methyltransferase